MNAALPPELRAELARVLATESEETIAKSFGVSRLVLARAMAGFALTEGTRQILERELAAPKYCPICGAVARAPVRVKGAWTWDCSGGCKP